MDAQEVVKKILEQQSKSQRSLARDVGVSPQTMYNRLNKSQGVSISDYVEMLNALDYEIKVVPVPIKDNRPSFILSREDGK